MYFSDGHCDFLYGVVNSGYDILRPAQRQSVSLDRLVKGGVKLQLFAAWMDIDLKRSFLSQFMSMADAFDSMLERCPQLVRLTPDFDPDGDKIAAALTIEGGEAVEGQADILRCVRRMGVCAMSLTWNNRNELASPALKKGGRGLTFLGKEIIREMARLNMAVDVSHLNDAGIDDVLAEDVKVFAPHSNSRAVYPSPRSLCDEHIREIAAKGGTVGVNFYHKQLSDAKVPTVRDVARHAMHILEVGGPACCAIGSDFDGMERYPDGLGDPSCLPRLANELAAMGLDPDTLAMVCGGNLMRFIKSVCQAPQSV
ncbi:MAG: membrane dipeptidase [Clostridia bacterium]|nr:membrane dipeptidase [Clostridia bacterium]